ncbi:hypothetical protein BpHYR1_053228 [Brachionus plicatilis]|uniref:Uncharacterized protein n=1 Tax=Brachionus plicatilis TaxID=10195 RepID=A0A3M7SHB4_BRAPC|nr:hypothetical protein BpHYR1_053228 [Brachionus plicatilis]
MVYFWPNKCAIKIGFIVTYLIKFRLKNKCIQRNGKRLETLKTNQQNKNFAQKIKKIEYFVTYFIFYIPAPLWLKLQDFELKENLIINLNVKSEQKIDI